MPLAATLPAAVTGVGLVLAGEAGAVLPAAELLPACVVDTGAAGLLGADGLAGELLAAAVEFATGEAGAVVTGDGEAGLAGELLAALLPLPAELACAGEGEGLTGAGLAGLGDGELLPELVPLLAGLACVGEGEGLTGAGLAGLGDTGAGLLLLLATGLGDGIVAWIGDVLGAVLGEGEVLAGGGTFEAVPAAGLGGGALLCVGDGGGPCTGQGRVGRLMKAQQSSYVT